MMANKCNKIFQEFKFSLSDVYLHQDVVFFTLSFTLYESLCAILCHLYKFENMQNTHGGAILLVKLYRLKPATLLKVTLLHGFFSRFLNCINGTNTAQKMKFFFKNFFSKCDQNDQIY